MNNIDRKNGFIHLLAVLLIGLAFLSSVILSRTALITTYENGAVLGEVEDEDEVEVEDQDEVEDEDEVEVEDQVEVEDKSEVEDEDWDGDDEEDADGKTEKNKTEIRFGEGERIRTRIDGNKTRIDVISGGIKVRYEKEEGKVVIKAETEEGDVVSEEDLFKITQELEKEGIKIETNNDEIVIASNNVGAVSEFPVQIDLNTNELMVTTPQGNETLAVLPDQAVQNLISVGIISRLGLESSPIALGDANGDLTYEILGLKDFKLLGFIPISMPATVTVSAQDGQVLSQEKSLATSIIDLLSP